MFGDGVVKLDGEYLMELIELARIVQHMPRGVSEANCERLQDTLEDLEKQEIIAKVTTPTPWISSMVVVHNKNKKLHICLDPKHLSSALLWENYPLPTIKDVATRLHGAKVFSILDA